MSNGQSSTLTRWKFFLKFPSTLLIWPFTIQTLLWFSQSFFRLGRYCCGSEISIVRLGSRSHSTLSWLLLRLE